MYDPARHYTRFEDGQAVEIPTTDPAITIRLNWQRCYRPELRYSKTPGYIGWFSYQNVRLRSIMSSTHVVLANARDYVSESPPQEQVQFNLEPLFNELNTVLGKELEKLSLLCFEQPAQIPHCWALRRRYPQFGGDRLFQLTDHAGQTLTADLKQLSVLYYHHTGDNSLWI